VLDTIALFSARSGLQDSDDISQRTGFAAKQQTASQCVDSMPQARERVKSLPKYRAVRYKAGAAQQ
jgi:hypothetical protein